MVLCSRDPKKCKAPADIAAAYNANIQKQIASLMSSLADLKTKGVTASDPRVKSILRKRDALMNNAVDGPHVRAVIACQAKACPDDLKSAVKLMRLAGDIACKDTPSVKEGCKVRDTADKVIKAPTVSVSKVSKLMKQVATLSARDRK